MIKGIILPPLSDVNLNWKYFCKGLVGSGVLGDNNNMLQNCDITVLSLLEWDRQTDVWRDILETSLQLWLAHRNWHCLGSDLFWSVVCPTALLLQWDLPLILSHHGTELVCIGPYFSPESPPLSPPALLLFCASSLGNYLPPRTWGPKGKTENSVFSHGELKEVTFILFTIHSDNGHGTNKQMMIDQC